MTSRSPIPLAKVLGRVQGRAGGEDDHEDETGDGEHEPAEVEQRFRMPWGRREDAGTLPPPGKGTVPPAGYFGWLVLRRLV